MRRKASGLFGELLSVDLEDEPKAEKKESESQEEKAEEVDCVDSEDEKSSESTKLSDENSIDVLIQGSPSYPRIFWGESAKPLTNGMFPETEYVDDNIHATYHGLISFLG